MLRLLLDVMCEETLLLHYLYMFYSVVCKPCRRNEEIAVSPPGVNV